jgi:threonine dehydratase
MIPYTWLTEAKDRIEPYIRNTPLTYDPVNEIYLKWENQQITGSFKARGAFNKVISLQDWERQLGLVAASAGNHGQGVAIAGNLFHAPVTIFAAESAAPIKISAMRSLGADVHLVPGGYGDAEIAGLDYAKQSGATWISPYNDGQIIAGQGTIGLEVLAELHGSVQPPAWIVPVGGGGLISGIGIAVKEAPLSSQAGSQTGNVPKVIGVQSNASPFFHAIFHQGSQTGVRELPSLADGLAGPVEDGSITIPIVRRYVDELILVSEDEIAQAIAYAHQKYQQTIEGSSAAALAAVIFNKIKLRPAVVVISGGNIQPELHKSICAINRGIV